MKLPVILKRVKIVTNSAERGNVKSMYKLGLHYYCIAFSNNEKLGDVIDAYLQGLYWLSKAAQLGVWESYFVLGEMVRGFYEVSWGGPYFYSEIKKRKLNNDVFKYIIAKTVNEFTNIQKDNLLDANAAWILLNFGLLFCDKCLYEYYYKLAAEHGCVNTWKTILEVRN